MAVFSKGNFEVSLGFVTFGGEFDDADRQSAWELYLEMMTRVAVRGKVDAEGYDDFTGELLAESLQSTYTFVQNARAIARSFPVGALGQKPRHHLGFFIAQMLEVVFRPFLEKWQAEYRHWWACEYPEGCQRRPTVVQLDYPHLDELLLDWVSVRRFVRDAAKELATEYELVDLSVAMPEELRQAMQESSHAPRLRRR